MRFYLIWIVSFKLFDVIKCSEELINLFDLLGCILKYLYNTKKKKKINILQVIVQNNVQVYIIIISNKE